jgi:hypothetical protein
MSFLKKLFDQANPFDQGKTWKNPQGNPKPVKQAPAQTPAPQGNMNFAGSKTYGTFNRPSPVANLAQKQIAQTPKVNIKNRYTQVNAPSYGSGLSGILNRAKDVVDANTPQDQFKRNQQIKAPLRPNMTYQEQQQVAPSNLTRTVNLANSAKNNAITPMATLTKAAVGQVTGNQQARNNALNTYKQGVQGNLNTLNSFKEGIIGSSKQIGTGLAYQSKDFQNAQKAQSNLVDIQNQQKLNAIKRAKQGFNTQQDVDRFVKYADNLWQNEAEARQNQINIQKEQQKQLDPTRNALAIADAGLTALSFGVAGPTKNLSQAAGRTAFENAIKGGATKEVATQVAKKAATNEIIRQSALTGSMGGFQGAINPYITKDPGTITPMDVITGAVSGGVMGGVLPGTFVATSKGAKPVQNALNKLSIDNQIGAVGKNVKDNLDPLEALKAEARKYKSADEFADSLNAMNYGKVTGVGELPIEKINKTQIKALTERGLPHTDTNMKVSDFKPGRKVTQPLEVYSKGGSWVVENGNHRLAQALANGDKTVPVVFKGGEGKKYSTAIADLYNQATQSRNPFKNQGGFAKNPFYKDPQVGKTDGLRDVPIADFKNTDTTSWNEAIQNVGKGKLSKTNGPVEVVLTKNGYKLVEGNHRAVQALNNGDTTIRAKVISKEGLDEIAKRDGPHIKMGMQDSYTQKQLDDYFNNSTPVAQVGKTVSKNIDDLKGNGQAIEDKELTQAIKENGVTPLLVDENGNLFEGHHRLESLKALGVDSVPTQPINLAKFDKLSDDAKMEFLDNYNLNTPKVPVTPQVGKTEPTIKAYHGSTNNKLSSLEPGAKTGLNEKRNLIYLTEDKTSASHYAKTRGTDGTGLGILSDSKTGKVYETEVTGKIIDAYNRDGGLSELKNAKGFDQLSGKTKNQLTNDTGLSGDILESNPELVKFLKDNNITAVRGHLNNTSDGATELMVVNPDKAKLAPQVGKTGASKAELGDTSLQSPEPVVQKTQQTQPNLSQAKNNADGLATGTEKSLQQKAGKAANNQTNLESGNTSTSTKQQRGFKSNIAKDTETPLSVYKDIPWYNVKPNKQTIGKAAERVAKDPEGTYDRLLKNGIQQTDDSADALVLLRNLVEKDELDKASKLARATAKAGTDFGQAVQIFSAFRKTTPDGALRDAWNIVNAYNTKNPKKTPIRISDEQSKRIVDLANDLQSTEYGTREWAKKAALLEREKGLLTPNSFLSKVSTVQTMAQLLNPKTAIRNILGNGVLDLAEDLSRLPAVGIDKALKGLGLIDERNMVLPNMKTNWANKLIGFKQGVEDVNLGIRTTGAAGNYDLTKEVFKPGSVGNKLEKLLGYELSSMDKAFYTGRYQSSLENMMKAQNVKVPTPEMKASAEAEALYATFQNNSALSKGLQKGKNALNAGKEWGLGDFILKYPKTPGNIVNVGLDYSPVGFVKGLKSLHDGIKLKNIQTIRNGELLLGRSLVGSGLIAGGAFLAKQGIITGKQDGDFDKSSADRDLGKGPFAFNITALGRLLKGEDTKTRPGDITANYDWLQPNAIQLSMGANMIINNNSATQQINTNLESLGAGIDTISEQPVFRGVKDFIGDLNTQQGGGLGKAAQGVATNSLSSFVPSLVNQLGQQFDNTKRSTYSDTPVGDAFNKVKGRIPGARNTLYPSLNTLGKEQKQYDVGSNNPFNVFFNPAFLNRVKDEPSLQLADDLNKKTGETSQYPRSLTGNQTIDGVKTKLTPEQLFSLKKNVGQNTNNIFQQYAASPIFQNLSDTEKVNALSGALTDINAAGKASLAAKNSLGQFSPGFTGKPTKLSGSQKALLSNEYSVDTKLAGTNIPKGLNQDAVKVIASYDKAKAKEIANNPTVTKALTDWNSGRPVPQITNEVAKQWADYEKGLKDGSITKLEAKDQKIKILRNAFNSQLNDDEKQLYKLSKTKIQSALSEGLITEDNVRRALAIEKQMFDNGLLDSETLAKKLGLGSRSKSSGKSSGTRRSSGRRSTKTAKAPKLKFTTTRVKNRQKSFNSSLRKLLASAKV